MMAWIAMEQTARGLNPGRSVRKGGKRKNGQGVTYDR